MYSSSPEVVLQTASQNLQEVSDPASEFASFCVCLCSSRLSHVFPSPLVWVVHQEFIFFFMVALVQMSVPPKFTGYNLIPSPMVSKGGVLGR